MDIKQQVANKVRQTMKNKKATISHTSELANIPYTTLQRKLNGVNDFTITELGRIADALKVHPAELMPEVFAQKRAA